MGRRRSGRRATVPAGSPSRCAGAVASARPHARVDRPPHRSRDRRPRRLGSTRGDHPADGERSAGSISFYAARYGALGDHRARVVHLAGRQEPRALRDALPGAVGGSRSRDRLPGRRPGWVDEAGQPVELPFRDRRTGVVTLVRTLARRWPGRSCTNRRRFAMSRSRVGRRRGTVGARQRSAASRGRCSRPRAGRLRRPARRGRRRRASSPPGAVAGRRSTCSPKCPPSSAVGRPPRGRHGPRAGRPSRRARRRARRSPLRTGRTPSRADRTGPACGAGRRRSVLPVVLTVPYRRFPAPQEAAAFFVCSEGLANSPVCWRSRVRIEVRRPVRASSARRRRLDRRRRPGPRLGSARPRGPNRGAGRCAGGVGARPARGRGSRPSCRSAESQTVIGDNRARCGVA